MWFLSDRPLDLYPRLNGAFKPSPASSICIAFGSPRISLTKATDGIDSTPAFTVHLRSRAMLSAGGRARICRPTALIGFAVVSYEATAKICQVQLYEDEFPGVLSSRP